jgi:transcriptional regulator with XRE-family HTH domain
LTTPVQQAKEALGERLREMRKDARLSGRALATALGWHFTKVSKVENGARSPSEDDIRAWCAACGAGDQVPDLIATVRHVASMYHEYRRQMQAGMKHLQESSVPLYEATSLFRIYDTTVVPGLFTTAEYAAELFRFWQGFMGMKDDVDAAVEARMERQRVLYTGNRAFRVVIEEQVLRTRVGDTDVMAGQLDRLLAVVSLPRVSIGIIPATGERHSLTQGSFWMFDDSRVRVETVSASLTITQPRDIALYSRVFELLQRSAVHGREARQLITRAIRDLTGEAGLAVNFCQHRCPTIPTLRSVELRSQPGRGSPGGGTRTSQLGERDARRQDEHRR